VSEVYRKLAYVTWFTLGFSCYVKHSEVVNYKAIVKWVKDLACFWATAEQWQTTQQLFVRVFWVGACSSCDQRLELYDNLQSSRVVSSVSRLWTVPQSHQNITTRSPDCGKPLSTA